MANEQAQVEPELETTGELPVETTETPAPEPVLDENGNPVEPEAVVTEEPKETTPEVPSIVQELSPEMAAIWNELPDKAKQAHLTDLANQLATQAGEPTPQGQTGTASPDAPEQPASSAARLLGKLPDRITEDQVNKLAEALGLEGELADILRKAIQQGNLAVEKTYQVGEAALGVADRSSKYLDKVSEDSEFEAALLAQSDALEPLADEQYRRIWTAARDYKQKGTVRDYQTAIKLAIHDAGVKPGNGTGGKSVLARTRQRMQASSLATGNRRATPPAKVDVRSLDDLKKVWRQKSAELG